MVAGLWEKLNQAVSRAQSDLDRRIRELLDAGNEIESPDELADIIHHDQAQVIDVGGRRLFRHTVDVSAFTEEETKITIHQGQVEVNGRHVEVVEQNTRSVHLRKVFIYPEGGAISVYYKPQMGTIYIEWLEPEVARKATSAKGKLKRGQNEDTNGSPKRQKTA